MSDTTASEQSSDWGIIGHARHVAALRRAVRTGAVHHAYLVSGPAQVGKGALARRFAQAVLCEQGRDGLACGACSACSRVERGLHPDVDHWSLERQVAEGGSQARSTGLSIETARAIASAVTLRPFEARWRVVIVADAETMSPPAQQAMLKTLEEPTGFTIFLLLTTDRDAMLETVQSRCVPIDLQLVLTAAIADGLRGRGVGSDEAGELAALARGRPGWAIEAIGQPDYVAAQQAVVEAAEAWAASSTLDRLITAYRTGDRFGKDRAAVAEGIETLQVIWRDLLLAATDNGEATVDTTRRQRLDPSGTVTTPTAFTALAATRRALADLQANVRPRLALEHMVSQWPTLS